MGCFGSREDARRKVFDEDWTGNEFAFAPGSVKDLQAFCPLDKIVCKYVGDQKELKDKLGEWPITEDKVKELKDDVWKALKEFHAVLAKTKDEDKQVFGKYTGKDAFAQMEEVMKVYAEKSGLEHKWPEEEAAEKPAGMGDEAPKEGDAPGEANDGGEEDGEKKEGDDAAAKEGAGDAPKMALIAPDAFGDNSGAAAVPKLLLSLMFYHPVFGDAVKAAVMTHELGGDKAVANLGAVACLTGAWVDKEEKEEKDSWGCAWLTGDDMDELKEVSEQKDAKALVFPGVVGAWKEKDDALGAVGKVEGKTKVLFKFHGKAAAPAGDKLHVFCR